MQSRIVVSETLIDCSDEKIGIRQVRSLVVVAGRSLLLAVVVVRRKRRRSSIILKGKSREIRAELEDVVTCLPS